MFNIKLKMNMTMTIFEKESPIVTMRNSSPKRKKRKGEKSEKMLCDYKSTLYITDSLHRYFPVSP